MLNNLKKWITSFFYKEKNYIEVSLFSDIYNERLPIEGWIKPCIICGQPTSLHFEKFYKKKENLYFFIYYCNCSKYNKDEILDLITYYKTINEIEHKGKYYLQLISK